jgi:hypothetical protein
MLGYLKQIWGLSIYWEAISNGMLSMLSMLSWSKDPSWRREEKKEKDTVGWTDGTQIASVSAIVRRVGTLVETLGTVGWTDSPIYRCVGRVAEEEQRKK